MIGKTGLDRVLFLISWWLTAIKSHNAIGFFDINKIAEDVARKLLNEIYRYQLENLNDEKINYPAIDLGDKIGKFGFQITSRKDNRKIRESLEKFAGGPNEIFANGIRFLLLIQEKKPQLKKDLYQKIYPNFEPENHILNADDLIKKIRRIYDTDKEQFYRIKEILEVEIAGKAMKRENLKLLRSKLLKGSQKYYDGLTGPNGRFKHLDISETILSLPQNEWINQQVAIEGMENIPQNILEALPLLWKKDCMHSVILGDGGMGKTVSIVRLWEDYLKKQDENSPIPLFIALNEYNQIADASKREGFIISLIQRNYGDSSVTSRDIWEIMKTPLKKDGDFIPSFFLLLDGFNEITLDKRELLIEIRRLIEQAKGIQIVINSRFDMRGNFNWSKFNLLKLLDLEDKNVESYLREQGVPIDGSKIAGVDNRLQQLIKNPMMLTLYAKTCGIQINNLENNNCEFKSRMETPGELLWNFLEAQVAQLPERLGDDPAKQGYYKFLLKFLLPALGYEMEKAGQFQFSPDELDTIIEHYLNRFCEVDFLCTFREYRSYTDTWSLESLEPRKVLEAVEDILNILSNEIVMLVKEGHSYRFLHQNFRDFFSALHIFNEISISSIKNEITGVLKERAIPLIVRRYVGEIDGEQYCKPFFVCNKGWVAKENEYSRLHKCLNLCRNIFDNTIGLAVWNIVEIVKNVRGELSGVDLSNLDLTKLNINEVICSRFYNGEYLAACFDGSLLHEKNIFFQGHESNTTNAEYSSDEDSIFSYSWGEIKEWSAETGECIWTFKFDGAGQIIFNNQHEKKKIISYGMDETIKEWSVETGECTRTYKGHGHGVNTAIYSPDGQTILSSSDDKTVKEWSVETGECIRTYKGHGHDVNTAIYSTDGMTILSTSFDKTIKEWSTLTGECLQTYRGHKDSVNSAQYNLDQKKILSSSEDCCIKEWSTQTGECIKTYIGRYPDVNDFICTKDEKKIVSISEDGTITEWSAETGKCIWRYKGHNDNVTSAIYSFDEKKILSSSRDRTIKEWSVETGECIRTYVGHEMGIDSAVYSPNTRIILSACFDGTLKEWSVETGKCIRTFKAHTTRVTEAKYSINGKNILSFSISGTVKLWDVESGKCLKIWKNQSEAPLSEYIQPDNINKNIEIDLDMSSDRLLVIDRQKKKILHTLQHRSGLFMQGCSFENIHSDCDIHVGTGILLSQYGVTFGEAADRSLYDLYQSYVREIDENSFGARLSEIAKIAKKVELEEENKKNAEVTEFISLPEERKAIQITVMNKLDEKLILREDSSISLKISPPYQNDITKKLLRVDKKFLKKKFLDREPFYKKIPTKKNPKESSFLGKLKKDRMRKVAFRKTLKKKEHQ